MRPKVHLVMWIILLGFTGISFMLFLSPFLLSDWKVLASALLFTSMTATLVWGLDRSHLTVVSDNESIYLKGFFNFRKIKLGKSQVRGYSIQQKADQYSGFHEEFQITTSDGRKIYFPRIAYSDYSQVASFCKGFTFLGHQELRYGKLIGQILTIMGVVSGVLFALVSIIKLL